MAGDLVLYSADSRNIHCVDEITGGERLTLTIWFSRNSSYDEDIKLISLMTHSMLHNDHALCVPLSAPSNMYWFSSDQESDNRQGFDIRFARLLSLGYDVCSPQGKSCPDMISTSDDISDVLSEPLKLARGDKLFNKEFANLLHALQAVQFYHSNQSGVQQSEGVRNTRDVMKLSEAQKEDVQKLRWLLSSRMHLDATIFQHSSSSMINEPVFDWECFSSSVTLGEEYTNKLHKQLLVHFPLWREHKSLFYVSS